MADGNKLIVLLLLWIAAAHAAVGDEEAPPEAEFLEYLGMWEETDEEWLLHEEIVAADSEERSDPAPEGEASTETKDEG